MTAYIFPGQGSQSKGMGKELFSLFPDITAQADAILGYSIASLCAEDPNQSLNQTQFTQPALYTVNALSYLKKIREGGTKPQVVAGHSLGEYNALFAAGVFDFATGLKLVKRRGELMSKAIGGGMAAVIGLKADIINNTLQSHSLGNVVIANYNSFSQLVISGQKQDVERAQGVLEQAGASLVVPLKVSGAFHSPLMRSAQELFELFLKEFHFSAPTIPVIANLTAKPYQAVEIANNLSRQISHPVLWTETINHMMSQNIAQFEEVGPGAVLTGLIRRIKNGQ